MSDINTISITGRLGQDPELSNVGSEATAKTVLRLASTRVFNRNGEKVEQTTWVNVVCWGRQAEIVKEYCSKGQEVGISGRLEIDDWQDQEGNKRKSTTIVADNVKFGARPGGSSSGNDKAAIKRTLTSISAMVSEGINLETAIKVLEDKENL